MTPNPPKKQIKCEEPIGECLEKFAVLETQTNTIIKQNDAIFNKLNTICPQVMENSWWIEKIKWAFVIIATTGFILGVVSLAFK